MIVNNYILAIPQVMLLIVSVTGKQARVEYRS